MNLVLLGGENISNKAWIESVETALRPLFEKTAILYYDHWQANTGSIDLNTELSKLAGLAKHLGQYAIFAKSIGCVLTLRAIAEGQIAPTKCIFIGPALPVGEKHIAGFPQWLEGFSIPTLFITKTSDPVAPAAALRQLLERYHVSNYQFIEISGDNHTYENLEQIKKSVADFLSKGGEER